ncbi:hypothetical protein BDZ89DRAFT_728392 [Hymenopellis radicata]|nr:hypothetical protein BDZ89DRAFT_728392 [Hymenopellis radicata]
MAIPAGDLTVLPVELIEYILTFIDGKSVAKCREVCAFFHSLVDDSAASEYSVELAKHGLKAHHSAGGSADSLQVLRKYVSGWADPASMTETHIDMLHGGLWELFGNVFAQTGSDGGLHLFRLPSPSLSIPESRWSIPIDISFRDFGMDPSQDLLILIESPTQGRRRFSSRFPIPNRTFNFHIRTVSTGEKHPLAKNPKVSVKLDIISRDTISTFAIQISGDHFGVFFNDAQGDGGFLVIWNWKTGEKEMHVSDDEMTSFVFLTDRHILICDWEDMDMCITIVDFKATSSQELSLTDLTECCHLSLPNVRARAMASIRCDPSPAWPNNDKSIPFYDDHDHLIYTISMWSADIHHYNFVVPRATILAHLDSVGGMDNFIPWEDWGETGARVLDSSLHTPPSVVWSCTTFGSKMVSFETAGEFIYCFDFNQMRVKQEIARGAPSADPNVKFAFPQEEMAVCTSDTVLTNAEHPVFTYGVKTSLPFRVRAIPITLGNGRYSVMCSQNNIIIVDSSQNAMHYRVLSF